MIRTEANGNKMDTMELTVGGGIAKFSSALVLKLRHKLYVLIEPHQGTALLSKACLWHYSQKKIQACR